MPLAALRVSLLVEKISVELGDFYSAGCDTDLIVDHQLARRCPSTRTILSTDRANSTACPVKADVVIKTPFGALSPSDGRDNVFQRLQSDGREIRCAAAVSNAAFQSGS